MTIRIQSAKAKGRRLQQFVCRKLSEITGIPFKQDGDIDNRPMGQGGTDVILRGKAAKLLKYDFECKSQESWSVHEYIKQAKQNTKKGNDWVLVCKRNRETPVVILDAETFFNLIKKILTLEGKI